ncbi:radical SAM protein [Ruminiclostridium cellulolyticum]|uniref:Radical SAM domain protein n=1 Tax=Ruminiclostridium cellulolyticum (strain ATCC 35319 / DSM 5812 / JCM 6584 / H10) TaxID=394503 RepID=B8I5F0_RUMCH|nr:radical SAM protein [Ruminiclostridium cellulolyticum]ACL76686.1 Radical SAM domain protein [Ruminiclostridium cellulolyticum H10]
MKTYKIREEKEGAMLFDSLTGSTSYLTELQYQSILGNNSDEFKYLFTENNTPLFSIFRPEKDREALPSDCLSAPSKVYFEITRRCNLKCVYCYNNSRKDFSKELEKEQIFRLIDELYEAGTFEIRLTGGEPTLHPDFFEIVKYIKSKNFFISLGTNGVWRDGLIETIGQSGIRVVIISLDGTEEYNDQSRGKGTFKAITNTIKQLKKFGNITLKINSVICRENRDQLEKIVALADELGIDGVNLAPLRVSGRADGSEYGTPLLPADMYSVVAKVTELRKKCKVKIQTYYDIIEAPDLSEKFPSSLLNKKSCAAGIEVAAISPFGEVYGCVVSPANETEDTPAKRLFTAGNLSDGNFIDIWLDSSRWNVYRNLSINKSSKCLECNHYKKRCFGNCVVDSYSQGGSPNAESPLCFIDIMYKKACPPEKSKVHKIGTAIIIEDSQGKLLLHHRDCNPKIKYPGTWVLFGGGKEFGETPEQAIRRELMEELNLDISNFIFYGNYHYNDEEEEHLQFVYHMKMDLDISRVNLNEGAGLGYFSRDEINKLQLGFNIRDIVEDFFKRQSIFK